MPTVTIKHRLTEQAERKRRRSEELEAQRREAARQKRARQRREFLLKKANEYSPYERLAAFAVYLEREPSPDSGRLVDRLIGDLRSAEDCVRQGFSREFLQDEIIRLRRYDEDLLSIRPRSEGGLERCSTVSPSTLKGCGLFTRESTPGLSPSPVFERRTLSSELSAPSAISGGNTLCDQETVEYQAGTA